MTYHGGPQTREGCCQAAVDSDGFAHEPGCPTLSRLAAALRREAHETLHQLDGLHYSNNITEERRRGAHALLARADRLDGSDDGQES